MGAQIEVHWQFPNKVAQDLGMAKQRNEGITLCPADLRSLVHFSHEQRLISIDGCRNILEEMSTFPKLLERATAAASTKVNFALTAEEVKVWYNFFDRTAKLSIVLAGGPEAETLNGLQMIEERLAACEKTRQDKQLDLAEIGYLDSFYRYFCFREKNTALLDRSKDPAHPQFTAMAKVFQASESRSVAKARLDTEEVISVLKLIKKYRNTKSAENIGGLTNNQNPSSVSSIARKGVQVPPSSTSRDQPQPLAPKDENKGVRPASATTATSADSTQNKKEQATTTDAKAKNGIVTVDDRLKAMVTKYSPDVVTPALMAKQGPLITRWLVPVETALKRLDEKAHKAQDEAEKLRKMVLDIEHGYEEELEEQRDAYAELEEETQEKITKLESELSAANDQLSKKGSMDEKKYEELLQIERGLYSKLKEVTEEKLAKLESELQNANTKIDKAKTNVLKREGQWTTKLQASTNQVATWKEKFSTEIARYDVLKLDYDATLEELTGLKIEQSKMDERDAKCAALENELAVLRSNRTNPQVEKDNIAKAVRDAIANKKVELEQIQASFAKVQDDLQSKQAVVDEQTQRTEHCEAMLKEQKAKAQTDMAQVQAELQGKKEELAKQIHRADQCEGTILQKQAVLNRQVKHIERCENSMKEGEAKIVELQESLAALNELQVKTLTELKEARSQTSADPTIVRALDEERMACTHLKDQLTSAADALQALASQLRSEVGL